MSKTTGLVIGRAILDSARIYKNAAEALAQAVENGRDADATRAWVILETDKITILDNGNGMIPEALPQDQEYLSMMEAVEKGEIDLSLEEIRDLVSEPTRRSFEWMMRFGSFSPKRPQDETQGERGIGHNAVYYYGSNASVTTVPYLPLARAVYGANIKQVEVPAYSAVLPSAQDLARNIREYHEIEAQPLTDPFGNKLPHGTRVVVTGLKEGIEYQLVPGLLASFLKDKFGPDIRKGRLTITVVDRITREGKAIKGGRIITVEPVNYTGRLIVNERMQTNALTGNLPFHVVIYLDPNGKYKRGPELHKQEAAVGFLTDLEELNGSPWNSGFFGGYAEFPSYQHSEQLWDPSKTVPLPGKERTHVVRKLQELEPILKSQLEEYRQAQRRQHRSQIAEQIEGVVARAMQDVDALRDLTITTQVEDGRKRKKKTSHADPKPQEQPATVVVKVLNEHNRGVPGVEITLSDNHRSIKTDHTRASGTIGLGTIPVPDRKKNHYLTITLPKGARLLELTEPRWKFMPNDKGGYRWIFRIKTGEKARERRIPRVKLVFTDKFADPDEPWQQKLHVGIVEINLNGRDFVKAEAEERAEILLAGYVAAAVVEYALPGYEISYCMKVQSLYFGALLNRTREATPAPLTRARRKS